MLIHLMDARDITSKALAEVIGSLEVALQLPMVNAPLVKLKQKHLRTIFT